VIDDSFEPVEPASIRSGVEGLVQEGIGFGGFFLYLILLIFESGRSETGTDGCSSSGSSSRSSAHRSLHPTDQAPARISRRGDNVRTTIGLTHREE
jgi:hypothetical protein